MTFKTIPLAALAVLLLPQLAAASVFDGKVIGLDAGHGNGETGAVGICDQNNTEVPEYLVNQAVRDELTTLINATATDAVYQIAQLDTRKARVEDAEANGSDILISIHHNGSSNRKTDYTKFFVTQKNDKELASVIYPFMTAALGLPGRGIKSDGYGMTVYGSLPGVLTESYFITNPKAACDFLDYQGGSLDTRIYREAQALFDGLVSYFSGSSSGDGGGGGGSCSPGKERQGKC